MKRIAFAFLLAFAALTATTAAWTTVAWADSSVSSTVTDEAP
jgi:hypothetical protein